MAEEEFRDPLPGPSKNPQGKHVSSRQRVLIYNLYSQLRCEHSKSAAIRITSKQLGISERTVWETVGEMDATGSVSSPTKKRVRETTYDRLDEDQKSAIRRHVHSFFLKNELPTCTKILTVNIVYIFHINELNTFFIGY